MLPHIKSFWFLAALVYLVYSPTARAAKLISNKREITQNSSYYRLHQEIKPPGEYSENGIFGMTLDMRDSVMVVGSQHEGAVVYERTGTEWKWSQTLYQRPSLYPYFSFGRLFSSTIVVYFLQDVQAGSQSSLHLFQNLFGTWRLKQTLSLGGMFWGWANAIDDDSQYLAATDTWGDRRAARSSYGKIYVYQNVNGQFVLDTSWDVASEDSQWAATQIGWDGSSLIYNAQFANVLHVFEKDGVWKPVQDIRPINLGSSREFGTSFVIHEGLLAVACGYPGNSIFFFEKKDGKYSEVQKLDADIGDSILDLYGARFITVDYNHNDDVEKSAIYTYEKTDSSWQLVDSFYRVGKPVDLDRGGVKTVGPWMAFAATGSIAGHQGTSSQAPRIYMYTVSGANMGPQFSGGSCFPADATAVLENGQVKMMDELVVGDKVQVGPGLFDDVFFFGHRLQTGMFDFVQMTLADGRVLALSEDHILYVNRGRHEKRAVDVNLQDQLVIVESGEALIGVVGISRVRKLGLYNPHTLRGDIVVNGVVASTYNFRVHPRLGHWLLAPERLIYRWSRGRLALLSTSLHEETPQLLIYLLSLMQSLFR